MDFDYVEGVPVLRDIDLKVTAGRDDRPRRRDGCRQDDADGADPALLRGDARPHPDRWSRPEGYQPQLAYAADRRRVAGPVPFLGLGEEQHPLRPFGRDRRGGGRGGECGGRARLHHEAGAGLRYGAARARPEPLGGPAPAPQLRARRPGATEHPDPRRGDGERRHAYGGDHPAGAAGAAQGPHLVRDRAPALDDPGGERASSSSTTAASPRWARTRSCWRWRASTRTSTA